VLLEALDPEELRPDRLLDHVGSQLGAWGLSRSHRSPCRFLRVSPRGWRGRRAPHSTSSR
jgi:hypothetical protein